MSDIFDYIVIGAGSAGGTLAARLSEDNSLRVLLLEGGGSHRDALVDMPAGWGQIIYNPRYSWGHQTEPERWAGGRRIALPRGKRLGGSSSINGMVYVRGDRADYDSWAAQGATGWSWAELLPYFVRTEDQQRGDGSYAGPLHGRGGPLRAADLHDPHPVSHAMVQAALQAGLPYCADFNSGHPSGAGLFQANLRNGRRSSVARNAIEPAMRRANLSVRTDALVSRIDIAERRAGAVRWRMKDGSEHVARAGREVLLCAGTLQSPQLLMLSGIGPAGHLRELGITVQADLPGVGANLQDHLQIRSVYKINGGKTLNQLASTLWGKGLIGLEYAWRRSGPMSMAPSQLGAFTRSSPAFEWPNIEYHVQPLSLDAFGEPLHAFPAITASVCNLNPTSRGTVHIKSARFEDAPAIAPNYLATDEDRRVAADSLRVTRRIMAQPAMARFRPEEFKPGVQYQSDDELARLAGDIASTIFHPVGTTAMGRDGDPLAVLTPRLQVRDGAGGTIAGLRVVDAGAMPTITSGNTNSPTLMMAEKAARWIAGR